MYCDNVTCKYNQLGLECTKVPYNIEFMCNERYTDFSKKGEEENTPSINNNEKVQELLLFYGMYGIRRTSCNRRRDSL